MSGNLISPRLEVYWGGINLMLYPLPGSVLPQPLITGASVDLVATGNTPTGTMSWSPSAPAVEVYEELLVSNMNLPIIVRFSYPNGKSISFKFVWAGQTINYGVNMGIEVKLRSELDGLINSNLRSYAQAYDPAAAPMQAAIAKLQQQYGVPGIVKYTPQAAIDLAKAKVESAYGSDVVFTTALGNLTQANGNALFASNIDTPSVTVYTPYSWEKAPVVINAATLTSLTSPKPELRYGYILGPAIIETIERSTEWQPPQQSNKNTPLKTPIPQSLKPTTNQNPPTRPQTNTATTSATPTSAPLGTSNNRIAPNMRLQGNGDGPRKQQLLNEEQQSKLTAQMFMAPVLTGIKPHDIVFIPSLTGKYMEDWVVESVGYEQQYGKISISIQATRPYGLGNAMQPAVAAQYLAFATGIGLLGPSSSVEAWTKYAWPSYLK